MIAFIDKNLPDQISNYDALGEAMTKERGKKGLYLFYDKLDNYFVQKENIIRENLKSVSEAHPEW